MTTVTETIKALGDAQATLEANRKNAQGDALENILTAIDTISKELSALAISGLTDADYIPQTNAFKAVTAEATAFVKTLNDIKTEFAALAGVAKAADTVMGFIK